MDNLIWVAFLTGLTTGGLSCMAVHGGLLTSSLAGQIEADLRVRGDRAAASARNPRLLRPILLFLLAKLAGYTALGFVLGALGSVLALTPVSRGILQLAIAVFMIGNGLRMLNVHPLFRFFSFEPPAALRRVIRRLSKDENSDFAPLLLGLLTVLIPCGVTQSMMAVAVGTGSPALGAAILFAFVLGTTPVFFTLVYLATRLGGLLEKYFTRLVAAALLVLGLITFDAGLGLVGSPFTFAQVPQMAARALGLSRPSGGLQVFDLSGGSAGPLKTDGEAVNGAIEVTVDNAGYSPATIRAPANEKLLLKLTTNDTYSCARAFVIPALDYSVLLDATGTQEVEIPAQPAGTKLRFACSMGMYTGVILYQ
jgi:sulfite exporter TauE/SafE